MGRSVLLTPPPSTTEATFAMSVSQSGPRVFSAPAQQELVISSFFLNKAFLLLLACLCFYCFIAGTWEASNLSFGLQVVGTRGAHLSLMERNVYHPEVADTELDGPAEWGPDCLHWGKGWVGFVWRKKECEWICGFTKIVAEIGSCANF
jgi:hypothetical protein